MGNLHGELLSSHKISQAWPGAPDEHGWTPIRKREQGSFIRVNRRSSAAGSAFANFLGRRLALGKMFSHVLALSEDWSGCLLTSP
jgi:hypothetical protein